MRMKNHFLAPSKFCISIVSISLGAAVKNKGYAKFGGANKVHYGRCASGV